MGAELSASIVHEIDQALTSVLANAQACSRWLRVAHPNIDEAVTSVARIVRDARAVDAVMRGIRSLLKKQPAQSLPAVRWISFEMPSALSKRTQLVNRFRLRTIIKDRTFGCSWTVSRSQQIIMNLVGNAVEAMQGINRPPLLRIRIRQTAGQVLTQFSDNGCGCQHTTSISSIRSLRRRKTERASGLPLTVDHRSPRWADSGGKQRGPGSKVSLLLSSPEAAITDARPGILPQRRSEGKEN